MAKTVGSTTTVYFAGLWEQVVGGARKLYYTFNGQVIALREGASGLAYLHGDHLGSVSVVSKANSAALLSQQEFDPWGKVRSGSVISTTVHYTGQRLDGSGLLYYHARMYNPVIGRFVSADTIAPDPLRPQMRNRYSYVLNNPLRYTDPTGHCTEATGVHADAENARCTNAIEQLSTYGILIEGFTNWFSRELETILAAAELFRSAAAWSLSDFKKAMGGGVTFARDDSYTGIDGTKYAGFQNNGKITLYDLAFAKGNDTIHTIVHELAHRWDEASGSKLSGNMISATGGGTVGCNDSLGMCAWKDPGQEETRPRQGADNESYFNDPYEDFAETVAARVTGNYTNAKFPGSPRWNYVTQQFSNYRSPPCKTCQ